LVGARHRQWFERVAGTNPFVEHHATTAVAALTGVSKFHKTGGFTLTTIRRGEVEDTLLIEIGTRPSKLDFRGPNSTLDLPVTARDSDDNNWGIYDEALPRRGGLLPESCDQNHEIPSQITPRP
jgi:hypothetical protein